MSAAATGPPDRRGSVAPGLWPGARAALAVCVALAAPASPAQAAAGWSPAAAMHAERRDHTATLLDGGKVLVAGGFAAPATLATAELYDPARDAWSSAGAMSTPRRKHTATLLADGRVLVAGGLAENASATAELYDPHTNSWSRTASMATAREGHAATLLADGRVLVSGGFSARGELASTELFDPRTGSWVAGPGLAAARGAHTATRLADGTVLVAGGFAATGATTTTERLVAGAGARAARPMSTPRESHAATLLADGRLAVFGGNATYGPTAATEVFDPAANRWSAGPSMAAARYAHTATALPTGRVLVTGGYAAAGVTPSAEIFDPVARTWSPAPRMGSARDLHTATLLDGGKVLVAGGFDGSASLATAELYTPRTATAIAVTASAPTITGGTITARAVLGDHVGRTRGDVVFEAFKPVDTTCSNVPGFVSTVPIGPDGSATSRSFTPTSTGTWRWRAAYAGDAEHDDARSACDASPAHAVVRKATPAIVTTSAASMALGTGQLTASARIVGRVAPDDVSTIDFRLYGPGDATCAATPAFQSLAVPYPPAGGTVTSGAYTPALPGTYRWRASYSGDASNAAVRGPCGAPTTTSWSLPRWRLPDS